MSPPLQRTTRGYRWTRPGALTDDAGVRCPQCGERCLIVRDCLGPTSFAEAMARRATPHDRIVCPHEPEAWHQRVGALWAARADATRDEERAAMTHRAWALIRAFRGDDAQAR